MKKICLFLSLIVIFICAHAQAPVNDEPCGAIDVPIITAEPILVNCLPTTVYSYANATLSPAIPNPTCTGGTSVTGEQRTGYIGTTFETANQSRISLYTRSNAGSLAERFYLSGDGNAWLQGALSQNSDIRLKKNIVPLQLSLNKLIQLNGYTYNG